MDADGQYGAASLTDAQLELVTAIRNGDRVGARGLVEQWTATHGYEHLLADFLEPVLSWIGTEWRAGETLTLAQAYIAAKVAEDALTQIATHKLIHAETQPSKGPVIIGNIVDDYHSLGRRMVGTFLRIEGWIVHDLGNDVLPSEFLDKATEIGAHVIGVSAMIRSTALNIRKLRDLIDERGLARRIQLAVGGAVFLTTPGLVDEVGGDGTAANALEASGLFDRLWKNSLEAEVAHE